MTVPTPRYVLLQQRQQLGPLLSALPSGPRRTVIFGFSDKTFYDAFTANSQLALTPYPLVKGFLQAQCDDTNDTDKLVVIDAAGPKEPQLNAVTMQSVLATLNSPATVLALSHRLCLDQVSQVYQIEKL